MLRYLLVIAYKRAHRLHVRPYTMPGGAMCALMLTLLLTGCGTSDHGVASKSAVEILAATRAAAQGASSVHVTSKSSVGGAKLTLDASLAENRGRAQVSVLGMGFEVIRVKDMLYVKGNPLFAARVGSALGVKIPPNTWLKGPATGGLGQTGAFASLKSEVPLILSGTGTVTKGARVKLDGQPTITVKLARKLYTGTLYVATTGQPYPLRLIKSANKAGPGESGQTTFTDWNDPVTVTPPVHAIDITQLQPVKKGH